jgi:hypothetical protein
MDEPSAVWLSRLKDIGPWILGFIALVQVCIVGLSKKLRKGTLEIYESGLIEIGYGDLGPGVALMGTLRCLENETSLLDLEVLH